MMEGQFGEKALVCLKMAVLSADDPERWSLYSSACKRWSEKAVCRKFEDLGRKGYVDYGVSPRTGWLTPKGQEALRSEMEAV